MIWSNLIIGFYVVILLYNGYSWYKYNKNASKDQKKKEGWNKLLPNCYNLCFDSLISENWYLKVLKYKPDRFQNCRVCYIKTQCLSISEL